jgi:hypothetical protein
VEKFRHALNEATEVDAEGRSPCLMVDLSNLTEIDYSALKVHGQIYIALLLLFFNKINLWQPKVILFR